MLAQDVINLAVAVWKDRVEATELERLRQASTNLLVAEADAKRIKKQGIILDMSRLQTSLRVFCKTYQKMAEKYGVVPGVDSYIRDMQKKIRELSDIKNHR